MPLLRSHYDVRAVITSYMPVLNLTGLRYGRLTAIALVPERRSPHPAWRCVCDCGKETVVVAPSLRSGLTRSCGCLRREVTGAKLRTHGRSVSREYNSWAHAKQRCTNPKNAKFADYGGRGITMCQEWLESFETFLRDMGPCPPGHTIDRIDNDGPYVVTNCRWAPPSVQANNKGSNHILNFRGESHTMAEWARLTGLAQRLIRDRVSKLGWDPERALTEPIRRW